MARLILTGFRAFPGVEDNPTQALVEHFQRQPAALPDPHHLALLDVDYRTIGKALDDLLIKEPKALVLTGYSNLATSITLEARATGICAPDKPDICGHVPPEERAPPAASYSSNADLARLHERLHSQQLRAEISHDAGQYVCNYSYRHALTRVAEKKLSTQVLFVHLPAIAGTQLAKGAAGTISFEEAARALALLSGELAA